MRAVVVRTAHETSTLPPLKLAVGDEVQVGKRDTEFPAFVFVTTSHGSGWVPSRYLSGSSGSVVVRTEYNTSELPTQVGEVLEVVAEDEPGGWLWCRSATGREGWLPTKTVDERT